MIHQTFVQFGLMYSIKIRQISHRTFGPSHRKCPTCPMIFVNTGVRSQNCGCLVTWFCYQLIAKPGNKTATVPWPDPYHNIEALPTLLALCVGNPPATRGFLAQMASNAAVILLWLAWSSFEQTINWQVKWDAFVMKGPSYAYSLRCNLHSWTRLRYWHKKCLANLTTTNPNGHHLIFSNALLKISLMFAPKGPTDNKSSICSCNGLVLNRRQTINRIYHDRGFSMPRDITGPQLNELTHWGRDKMAAISQTTFSIAFSSMKIFQLRLKFHWSLFLRV